MKEADRRKDEFLATLAHELRNPLAPIRNSLHLLRLSGALGPSLDPVREIMERQVDHMVRLVDDLLDVSRIASGKVELRKETVELATIVAGAVVQSSTSRCTSTPSLPCAATASPTGHASESRAQRNGNAAYAVGMIAGQPDWPSVPSRNI